MEKVNREIEEIGYIPSEYIKKILIQELKKESSRRAVAWAKAHRLPAGKNPVEEEIREDRDLQ